MERWFAELTTRKLRRSAQRSGAELEADLRAWVDAWNQEVWGMVHREVMTAFDTQVAAQAGP